MTAGPSQCSRDPWIPLPMRWARLLVPVIYIGCFFGFVADVTHDNPLAYGVAYLPLVCTAVFHRNPRHVWFLASVATIMIGIGYFLPSVNADVVDSVGNRLLSLAAVLVTAILVRYARGIQDQLAEKTLKAEAGERLKSEVFNNLSHEFRTPLHSIFGFIELMIANCRPDQRPALEQVQAAGKRLLGSIDNLIDLTNLEHRKLDCHDVDLAEVARQMILVTQNRKPPLAKVKLQALEPTRVSADPWAVRRVLENLISNAIDHAGEAGTIRVKVESAGDWGIATVQDWGLGMHSEVVAALNSEPSVEGGWAAGAGLTLSRGLAETMGGELEFQSEAGHGTVVQLRLPRSSRLAVEEQN